MAFTVLPLHNLLLPEGTKISFANNVTLMGVPEWIITDPEFKDLSYFDRQGVQHARHAFVAEYAASAMGTPDPEWKGKSPRSIQRCKFEDCILANLALWIVQPSTVCFTVAFHALTWPASPQSDLPPRIRGTQHEDPLYCHPANYAEKVSVEQVVEAAKLHEFLVSIPRNNSLGSALRSLWGALITYQRDIRYTLIWIAIEALFGPSDGGGEITYKLSQRIAFFTSTSQDTRKDAFRKAKLCYAMRSKIVHGRWEDSPKMEGFMGDSESLIRLSLLRLLNDKKLMGTFLSKDRDAFLDEQVFNG